MPVASYKLGPGTLTLGEGGSAKSLEAQLTNCRVSPSESVSKGDTFYFLDGGTLDGDETATLAYVLAGTIMQDIAAASVVDYSWVNAGEEVPFAFVPSTAAARAVEGVVRIVPFEIGGDANKRNTSDFSWSIIGTPTFGAA